MSCFKTCRNLSSVTFEPGSAISELAGFTFEKCYALVEICLPSSIEKIGPCCFQDCHRLKRIVIEADSRLCPASLKYISAQWSITVK
jgi:hypothetical protein